MMVQVQLQLDDELLRFPYFGLLQVLIQKNGMKSIMLTIYFGRAGSPHPIPDVNTGIGAGKGSQHIGAAYAGVGLQQVGVGTAGHGCQLPRLCALPHSFSTLSAAMSHALGVEV